MILSLWKKIMKPVRREQARGVIEIANVLQRALDAEEIPPGAAPGVAFSISLMRNTVDSMMEEF